MQKHNGHEVAQASAMVRKLRARQHLDPETASQLEEIQAEIRSFPPRSDILREGQPIERVVIVRSGWLYAYKGLSDGRRQIIHFLLPGDLYGLFGAFPGVAELSLSSLTPVEIAVVPVGAFEGMMRRSPALMAALGWVIRRDMVMLQEQIVRLGRRSARERTAHLLLELCHRLRAVDLIGNHHFQLPLSQVELSDMLGLSGVHMNRTLRSLQKDGLIEMRRRWIRIIDPEQLHRIADYRSDMLSDFLLA